MAGKFKTKYIEVNPYLLSWTSTDNVKFDALKLALTTDGKKHVISILLLLLVSIQVLIIYIMTGW